MSVVEAFAAGARDVGVELEADDLRDFAREEQTGFIHREEVLVRDAGAAASS